MSVLRITAKPIVWDLTGRNSCHDRVYGVHIYYDEDDVEGEQYTAIWGEETSKSFATEDDAKKWCQEQVNEYVAKVAVLIITND